MHERGLRGVYAPAAEQYVDAMIEARGRVLGISRADTLFDERPQGGAIRAHDALGVLDRRLELGRPLRGRRHAVQEEIVQMGRLLLLSQALDAHRLL